MAWNLFGIALPQSSKSSTGAVRRREYRVAPSPTSSHASSPLRLFWFVVFCSFFLLLRFPDLALAFVAGDHCRSYRREEQIDRLARVQYPTVNVNVEFSMQDWPPVGALLVVEGAGSIVVNESFCRQAPSRAPVPSGERQRG